MQINLIPVLPELFVAFMIVIMLLIDAFISDNKKAVNTGLTLMTLVGALVLQLSIMTNSVQLTFNGMFILDNLAVGSKLILYLLSITTVLYIKQYVTDNKILKGEFYAIYLFAILGMMVMITANNFLVLYIGLELLSLALYGLIALSRDNVKATEAALKYFILGALASGILLYGISFIYGATGALQLNQIVQLMLLKGLPNSAMLTFGLVFIVGGLVFKLGLVPFHMWIPDVYEGSPVAVTTIIASLTKIAAVIFMIRFLVGGLIVVSPSWSTMLLILSCLSLFFGNIIAVVQTNIKRLFGYSTVANMGFVALGIMVVNVEGVSAALFYIFVYSITTLAGFGILTLLSAKAECETLDDLRGLAKTHPIYAALMLLAMFSLAGIPPLAGFYAKFKILEVLINADYIAVAIFAVIMSLIGAFIYLRVVKTMYFDEPVKTIEVANTDVITRTTLVLNGLIIIVLGIMPGGLLNFCVLMINQS